MKKHVYVLIFGTYAAALIGYCIYQLHQYRHSFEPLVPYSHPMVHPETTETAAQATVTARSTTTTGVFPAVTDVTTTTAVTSTAAVTSAATTPVTTAMQTTAVTATTPVTTTTAVTETTAVVFPLDLNTATLEQLCALPEIGEVTAQAILDYRESHGGFVSRRELLDIEGIGEGRYEAIYHLLYIDNEQELPEEPAPVQTVTESVTEPITEPDIEPPTEAETEMLMIDLNTATIDDLMQLPGCDETAAQAILDLREMIGVFHNPLEILMAKGISNAKYVAWEPYLAVDGEGHTQLPVDRNP